MVEVSLVSGLVSLKPALLFLYLLTNFLLFVLKL